MEIVADEIGPSLRYATAQVTRTERKGPGESAPASRPTANSAPSNTQDYGYDEEPF